MLYDLGPRIVKLRREADLTQQELVDRAKSIDPDLHLTDSVLGKYENDKAIPRLAEAAAIADIVNVSLDYLAYGEKSRCLQIKGLTDEQMDILIQLTALFRQLGGKEFQTAGKTSFNREQSTILFRIMSQFVQ